MEAAPNALELPPSILNADSLPSLPAVAMEVLRLTGEEGTTLDDLATAISRDPALAAKLLKLSNSSLFSMSHEVSTLQKATMVLGMKSVMLMALSFSLSDAVPKGGAAGGFNYQAYWLRSLVGAVAGRSLANLVGHPELADEAFLCGLLAHFGGLVMAECLPEDYAAVLIASQGNWPAAKTEEQLMGFNQSDVIMALLESWNIPPLITKAVGYMQRPQSLPRGMSTEVRELTAIMTLTALCVRVICDTDQGRPLRQLNKWAGQKYGIPKEQLDAFMHELEPGIKETADMLAIDLPAGHDHEALMRGAKDQLLALSIGIDLTRKTVEQESQSLKAQNEELGHKATTDALSGLPNRAALDELLNREILTRLGRSKPLMLGVIMIDIDHFKSFNDTHGHAAGDAVIQAVAERLASSLRPSDTAARYGGEEFTVIMPLTTFEAMLIVAERLRSNVEALVIPWEGKELKVTISLGCAALEMANTEQDGDRLREEADQKLYEAKQAGRNRVAP